ncbi:MAG: class II aldolase/adducin family protein [Pseudomonadales bacterium]|nr:class II aldolase/adducin family protein [Pseudomonadales bacterium]
MTETEGVIKYANFHEHSDPGLAIPAELQHWRERLMQAGLVGQDPARYDGYGFGNLSVRVGTGLLVTGSQTGHVREALAQHFALVTRWDTANNALWSQGLVAPSSESMSHAAVYDACPEVAAVFHAHSPDIWQAVDRLGIAATGAEIPYGTPEMAVAVARLVQSASGILVMKGHEDGVLSWGTTGAEAGEILMQALREATG